MPISSELSDKIQRSITQAETQKSAAVETSIPETAPIPEDKTPLSFGGVSFKDSPVKAIGLVLEAFASGAQGDEPLYKRMQDSKAKARVAKIKEMNARVNLTQRAVDLGSKAKDRGQMRSIAKNLAKFAAPVFPDMTEKVLLSAMTLPEEAQIAMSKQYLTNAFQFIAAVVEDSPNSIAAPTAKGVGLDVEKIGIAGVVEGMKDSETGLIPFSSLRELMNYAPGLFEGGEQILSDLAGEDDYLISLGIEPPKMKAERLIAGAKARARAEAEEAVAEETKDAKQKRLKGEGRARELGKASVPLRRRVSERDKKIEQYKTEFPDLAQPQIIDLIDGNAKYVADGTGGLYTVNSRLGTIEHHAAGSGDAAQINQDEGLINLIDQSFDTTGLIPVISDFAARILPQFGTDLDNKDTIVARQKLRFIKENMIEALKKSGRVPVDEQNRLLQLVPSTGIFESDPRAALNLRVVRDELIAIRADNASLIGDGSYAKSVRVNAQEANAKIDRILRQLGKPMEEMAQDELLNYAKSVKARGLLTPKFAEKLRKHRDKLKTEGAWE